MIPIFLLSEITAAIMLLFFLAWCWARACDNYSLVDAFWAGGLAVSGLFFLLATGPWNLKKEGIALLFAIWSLRLTWHLTYRIAKAHPEEDRRTSPEVCQKGFWNYSRHPNYFFEILIWISFYLIACGSPGGWMTFYAPATIILPLLKVTEIPPTEAASLRSKGETYRAYQKTTSVLIPWSPKKSSSLKSKIDIQQLN